MKLDAKGVDIHLGGTYHPLRSLFGTDFAADSFGIETSVR
jgi:hypothetical protein